MTSGCRDATQLQSVPQCIKAQSIQQSTRHSTRAGVADRASEQIETPLCHNDGDLRGH